MTYQTILVETDSRGIATVTLNQPEKHNVMSPALMADLQSATSALSENDSIRAIVLTGAGKSFCAGGDLGWMKAQMNATRDERVAEAMKLARMLRHLNELPKPMIAKVQGQAFGGGIGMISVCDVAIGVESAKFALTETKLGLIPATISPYVLARLGEANARRVFMSGRRFDAAEACDLGLLARCVSSDELDDVVEAEIAPYLSTAPKAVATAKALARSLGPVIDEATIERTANLLADTWEQEEASQGIAAFFEKRQPPWVS